MAPALWLHNYCTVKLIAQLLTLNTLLNISTLTLLTVLHTFPMVLTWRIVHFIVACLVAKPLNRSEAKDDLVMMQTLLLFKCKLLCWNAI